ncbi:putative ABC transport system ATP-binding protein [Nocardioides daedukensis]|uniref:Putative ABC transport system ATP-binding protein n=1 Tax=Nocardioides daedukensis TaxID=634462 RepID=A0A7Y9S3X6_9ACTN|nr:putative ABC transport system ATP-binding protein [Nocardioides daedukensis]
MVKTADAVVVQDLGKSFRRRDGETVVALDGVTLSAPAGAITAVTGPSGAGKTTLLQCLAGLEKPDSGTVRIAGDDVTAMRERELTRFRRERLGFVFQSLNLLPNISARENILLPLRLDGAAVEETRLAELAERLELSSRLGHRPGELSGDQQQRVAIARALLPMPDVLLADEPTSALDPTSRGAVLDLLDEWVREHGLSVVAATHDPEVEARAGRVHRLTAGRTAGAVAAERPLTTRATV